MLKGLPCYLHRARLPARICMNKLGNCFQVIYYPLTNEPDVFVSVLMGHTLGSSARSQHSLVLHDNLASQPYIRISGLDGPICKKYNKTAFGGSQVHSCIQTDLFYSELTYILVGCVW